MLMELLLLKTHYTNWFTNLKEKALQMNDKTHVKSYIISLTYVEEDVLHAFYYAYGFFLSYIELSLDTLISYFFGKYQRQKKLPRTLALCA